MSNLMLDLRSNLRTLKKNPGFATVIILTLALAIGANTVVFSLVHALLFRPLPFRNPEKLVQLWRKTTEIEGKGNLSPEVIEEFGAISSVFEGVAGYATSSFNFRIAEREYESITAVAVRPPFFSVLGVQPNLGRTFTPQDFSPSPNMPLILSHELWQRKFQGDRNIIGRVLNQQGFSIHVVGVMPQGFRLFRGSRAEAYVPYGNPGWLSYRDNEKFDAVARLRSDVSLPQAQAAITTAIHNLEKAGRLSSKEARYEAEPLRDFLFGSKKSMTMALLAVVELILLAGCVNIANMMLARAARNERDYAIRQALGANRVRLLAGALIDSLVLGVLGAGLGLLSARWIIQAINRFFYQAEMGVPSIEIDGIVIGFTVLVALGATVLFGALPALRISRVALQSSLRDSSRIASATSARHRMNKLLVVSEVSLCLVLLIGTGLITKSMIRLVRSDLGFRPEHILICSFESQEEKLENDALFGCNFLRAWPRRIVELVPGVEEAALTNELPVSKGTKPEPSQVEKVTITGKQLPHPGYVSSQVRYVSADYFHLLNIPLKAGRYFTDQDSRLRSSSIGRNAALDSSPSHDAAIINENFARLGWGDSDPTGSLLKIVYDAVHYEEVKIVGVVGDVKTFGPKLNTPLCELYRSAGQRFNGEDAHLLIKTRFDAGSISGALRQQMKIIDPRLAIHSISPLSSFLADQTRADRMSAKVMGWFGAVALLLSFIGIHGLISYIVSERTAEVGIRIALGARPRDVLRLVLGQGVGLALLGIVVGILAAIPLTGCLSSLLYGVSSTDLSTFVAVSLLLLAVAFAASYLPARRAMSIDPLRALNWE